jgi:glycine cleavage system H protein
MNIPVDLKYTKEHEWARIEGDIATIGITEFAVSQLGDITLVEMPAVGASVKSGDAIGTIESVKAVSDLFSPVSGTVEACNDSLENAPEKINEDAYDAGWILRIRLTAGTADLMDAPSYSAYIASLDH